MSDKILDDNIRFARFRKPVTLEVDKEAWSKLCDELHKKANIGTFIIIAIGTIVAFFVSSLVFIASVGFGIFISINARKRFNHLRTLGEHTFTISSAQIVDNFGASKQTIPLNKIKKAEVHSWGLELDTKTSRKTADKDQNEGRILIPCKVKDYGRVLATFEEII